MTDWHETLGGNVRIVLEGTPADASGQMPQTVRGAVEVKLAPGWHTYWRDPGASGIPPTFMLGDGSDVKDVRIDYPAPVWVETDYGSYAGYKEPVVLPFEIETGKKADVSFSGNLILGVCQDICIPVVAPFDLMVKPSTSTSQTDVMVAAAFQELPQPAPDDLVEVAFGDNTVTITVDQALFENAQSEMPGVFAAIDGMNLAKPKLIKQTPDKAIYTSDITYVGSGYETVSVNVTVVHGADVHNARFVVARSVIMTP
ncbi:MAG: protein-disulfide reductase DsbD domain-containing protein [Pseudomonadota bacterium]